MTGFLTLRPFIVNIFRKFTTLQTPLRERDAMSLIIEIIMSMEHVGAHWLSGRVLDSRQRGRGLDSHQRHCFVSLSKKINPSLVLVQPRKTRPFIIERLLMGRNESNQTNHGTCTDFMITRGIYIFTLVQMNKIFELKM